MRGHTASQSPAISKQLPRELCEISMILLVSRLVPRNHQNDSESLEKSFQNRSRERLRASKIDSESVVGPSWDASWQPRAFRERLGSVSGHPRRVPGAPQEPPKTPRDVRKSAREHMRERRGDQNQRQVVSWSGKTKFLSRGSCTKQ